MKKFFTLSLLMISLGVLAQEKKSPPASTTDSQSTSELLEPRGQIKTKTSPATPAPYDVNDTYMGRKAEFLNNLTVTELPADFPVYEKQWNLKEYNQVVTAFYYNHMSILKESVRRKLESLQH